MMGQSAQISPHGSARYLNRELSWVALYRRLLYEAADDRWPILTRLTRLAQVSTYLDEYFMVRAAALKQAIAQAHPPPGPDGLPPPQILQRLRAGIWPLLQRQQSHFTQALQPALAQQGIGLHNYRQLSPEQQARLRHRFEEDIAPLLTIPRVYSGPDWPEFSNLSLTVAVGLQATGYGEASPPTVAWIKVPRSLPRFLATSPCQPDQPWLAVPLEQAIAAHLDRFFPQQPRQWWATIRVTRSAQFDRDDPDADDLMAWVEENLQQRRHQGTAVRLEIAGHLPPILQKDLQHYLGLTPLDCYWMPGWLAYGDLVQVADLPRPDSNYPPCRPPFPPAWRPCHWGGLG